MDIERATQIIERYLTTERFEHSIRVAEVAKDLAEIYKVNQHDAVIAALFHDIAKDQSKAALKQNITHYSLPKDLLNEHYELWHGPVGAKMMREIDKVTDEHVYKAIYYHTTGRAQMSDLELVIYIADYIEPKRTQPGVKDVRKVAKTNLIEAALLISSRTIKYLIDKRATIHINTFLLYHDLLNRLEQ